MTLKRLAATAFALITLTTAASAQTHPLREGTYVCRKQGSITGSFEVTSKSSYLDSNGRQGSYQYDPQLNVLDFDTGKQYFIGRQDLLILVENGQLSKHGCVRQVQ